jgi:hypothetical protein
MDLQHHYEKHFRIATWDSNWKLGMTLSMNFGFHYLIVWKT